MAKARSQESADLNMTPMIDVVFQLIIFFVVTLQMTKEYNKDIKLDDGKYGEVITAENQPTQTIIIEVSRRTALFPRGRISINNAQLSLSRLSDIVRSRYNKFGSFPVLIRADKRALHEDVKAVMDICTRNGVWKIGFVGIAEHKEKE